MDQTPRATKLISSLLCGALLLASPGANAYAAAGRIVSVQVNAPLGQGAAGAGLGKLESSGFGARTLAMKTGLGLSLTRFQAVPSVVVGDKSGAFQSLKEKAGTGIQPIVAETDGTSAITATAEQDPLIEQAESLTAKRGGLAASARRVIRSTIRSIFSSRKDAGDLPAGVQAAQDFSAQDRTHLLPNAASDSSSQAQPPAPPAPAESGSNPNQKSINWFLGGLLVSQVGIEILGLAMPLLMREKFGGFSALAQIAVWSSMAGIAGRLSGGWISNHLGVKAAYIGATAIRLLSISAMVVFLLGPASPLLAAAPPLAALAAFLGRYPAMLVLIGFYSFNGLMAGISITAEKSIPTVLLGNDRATLERFFSLQQWLTEIVGVTGPKAGGVLVQMFGFTAAIAVYPVMLAIALVMYLFGIRMPRETGKAGVSAATAPAAAARPLPKVMALLAPMNQAISGAFGEITAFLDGLVLKAYLGRWIEQMGGKGNLTDADEQTLLTRSTLAWTLAGALSLAGFLTLLLPATLPAYALMAAFGVAEVIASQKLYSLILSRTKSKGESVKVTAAAGASLAAISTLALNLAGLLFDHYAGLTAFLVFNAAMGGLSAAVFILRRLIQKTDEAGSPGPAKRPTGGFGLLFKDPLMRWAFLAFAALSVTNPLLYQIVSQAFGLIIVGGDAALASGVASWITALYSLGGLLGALYMWRESTLISDAKKKEEPKK